MRRPLSTKNGARLPSAATIARRPISKKELEQPARDKFRPLATYIKDDGHTRIQGDTGEELRLVPKPFPRPVRKSELGETGYGNVAYEFNQEVRQEVEYMTALGISIRRIADCLHIDEGTLREHFEEELTTGPTRVSYAVGRALIMKAVRGDYASIEWFMKNRMGWREPKDEMKLDLTVQVKERLATAITSLPIQVVELLSKIPSSSILQGTVVPAEESDSGSASETKTPP